MERLESYARYNCASAMLSNIEVNLDRLKNMINLFVPVKEQRTLWTQINMNDQFIYNYSVKHKIILIYCWTLYSTQMQQDAAYLKCITLLAPEISNALETAFDWYTRIPSNWNVIKEPQGEKISISISPAIKIRLNGPVGISFKNASFNLRDESQSI